MMQQPQSVPAGVKKRSRQACTSCRSRKIKCSAERPTCVNCRQNCRSCSYEPYSSRTSRDGDDTPGIHTVGANAELLKRISTIESMLGKLNPDALEQIQKQATNPTVPVSASPTGQLAGHPQQRSESISTSDSGRFRADSFETLPPRRVMQSLIDTYFMRVSDEPYSFFHEADFRQRFESNSLPGHLLFAISSIAVRFINHQYFSGRVHEASAAYSKQAWLLVLTEHLMVLSNITLQVIQTISILAAVDYTAGRVSAGWLKVGLAARLAQGLDLMDEPPAYIPAAEQEERRRTFWSIYLLDRLISCARARPPAISDDDCHVSLDAGGDYAARADNREAQMLRPLLSWDTKLSRPPRSSVLALLMAMVLGRCTKFAHGRSDTEKVPPYDPKSDFMAINSSLMLLESYLDIEKHPIAELIREVRQNDTAEDTKQLSHLIFARSLFHLSHCLLNHPFLLRYRLSSFSDKVPRSFSLRALQVAEDNARKLTYLLSTASEGGVLVESSFYTYCVAVSGAIHTMADKAPPNEDSLGQYDAAQYFQRSIEILNRLGHLWPMVKNIETRLRRFHDLFPAQLGLFDPSLLTSPIDPSFDELLWSVVDYNTLAGELPKWDVFPSMSALPSPSLWDMDMALPSISHELDLEVNMFPEASNMFSQSEMS